jgi:hypothetical protein
MSNASSVRRPPAACTIISRNYLSHARVLAQSYAQYVPGGRFYLLIVDRLPDGARAGGGIDVIDPDELALPYFPELCFKYDVTELSTAVKPSLLRLLLNGYGEERVVYFDPDILLMRPLEELWQALDSASIVLTPHLLRPIPLDGKRPSEQDILIAGAYNLGFLALRQTKQTQDFLPWWEKRLREGCRVDVLQGLMTDQKWIDLVPGLFPDTAILRDDTYNVAYWNMHHREISWRGEHFLVNGRPLAFFHFSGFDPTKPQVFSKHQDRTKVVAGTALADLLNRYIDLHLANGFAECRKWTYGYDRFDNGVAVGVLLRRLYLDLDEDERRRFGDPFRTDGPQAFLDWATRPDPDGSVLSPFLLSLYQFRFDLWAAFPDVRGRDRGAFLEWAAADGARDLKYDPRQMRISEVVAAGRATADAAPADGEGSASPGAGDGRARAGRAAAGAAVAQLPAKAVRRYQRLVRKAREVARAVLPPRVTVAVISRGDEELLRLGERTGWHFPQTAEGMYAGYNPADSAAAIGQLEELRARGAQYLLVPGTALWWLEHYADFRRHLEGCYRVVARREDTCVIYELGPRSAAGAGGSGVQQERG